MHPKSLDPYYEYLQREVRIARAQRDLAVSQFLHDAAGRIACAVSNALAAVLRRPA